jgi:hypothetical protein
LWEERNKEGVCEEIPFRLNLFPIYINDITNTLKSIKGDTNRQKKFRIWYI